MYNVHNAHFIIPGRNPMQVMRGNYETACMYVSKISELKKIKVDQFEEDIQMIYFIYIIYFYKRVYLFPIDICIVFN